MDLRKIRKNADAVMLAFAIVLVLAGVVCAVYEYKIRMRMYDAIEAAAENGGTVIINENRINR